MFLKIVASQVKYRWGVSLLLLLAMASLVTVYVYLSNTTQFTNRSMQLVMKNMGHNLLILPKGANPLDTYLCSDKQIPFPEETTQKLSQALNLDSKYYVSVLHTQIVLHGHTWLLTGIQPVKRGDEIKEKQNLIAPLSRGQVRLGYECSRMLNKNTGDHLAILGADLRVVDTFPSEGSIDDCRIYVNLAQCQELVGMKGQINLILAFLCLHRGDLEEVLTYQRRHLAAGFPQLRQITKTDIAMGRYLARTTTYRSFYYLVGIVLVVTILVIASSGLHEVSDRKRELGVLVSMGAGYLYIVALYLAKMLAIALTASMVGFLLGSLLAVWFTSPFLVVHTQSVTILWNQLPRVVGLTCLVALVAEVIPMAKLVHLDPNAILVQE